MDRTPSRPHSLLRPLVIYWLLGLAVAVFYLRADISQIEISFDRGHLAWIGASLVTTLITTLAYAKVSTRGRRRLHWPTLVGFPLANGLCETSLFLASFKLGANWANSWTTVTWKIYWVGVIIFCTYSGVIHALFWLRVLPPHLNKDPTLNGYRLIWITGLVALTYLWAWLYFAYQDFWSVAVLHTLFDAGMVYCIHYVLGRRRSHSRLGV